MTARILCIEDEPELAEDLTLELGDAGYRVDLCGNGEVALALLVGAVEAGEPHDLVLCDVQMPGLTGPELLQRRTAAGITARFVMLTAFCDPELHQQCRDLGAARVLVKPVDYDQLLDAVAAVLAA